MTSDHDIRARRWDITHAIEEAWAATDGNAGTFEARLARTVDEHARSRTIRAQMIRDVAELALGRVAELAAAHLVALDATRAAHADEVARLVADRDEWKDMCQTAHQLLDEKRTIREERTQKAGAEDCDVVISNGYVGWTVAGLEEIAYRLRCGGAADDTPVEVDKNRAAASVPAPNLVTLDASPRAVVPEPRPEPVVVDRPRVRVDVRLAVGLLLVVLSIVVGAVVL